MHDAEARTLLLELAAATIYYGFEHAAAPACERMELPAWLHEPGACFATLKQEGELRGCIGSLEARASLARDVVDNAYSAAFRDPRFSPLAPAEAGITGLEVSVLAEPELLTAASRDELLAQLQPGIDGLIIDDGHYRATFLPAVWEQLPDPESFLHHLELKAGMAGGWWHGVRAWRYTTTSTGSCLLAELRGRLPATRLSTGEA